VQHDPTNGNHDVSAKLDQSLAESGHLCSGRSRSLRSESDFLHEHVGGRCHQDPELVGPESGATRAVDLQPVMEFFDPVLDVSPITVGRIHPLRGASQVGDDIPGVVPGRSTFESDHLGLDDDTALVGPTLPRGVPAVSEEVRGFASLARSLPGLSHELRGTPLQDGVFSNRDDVVEPWLLIEEVQDLFEPPLVMGQVRRQHVRPMTEADRLRHAHPASDARSLGTQRAVEDCGVAYKDQSRRQVRPTLPLDLDSEAGDVYASDAGGAKHCGIKYKNMRAITSRAG